jgi:hypothetical protein
MNGLHVANQLHATYTQYTGSQDSFQDQVGCEATARGRAGSGRDGCLQGAFYGWELSSHFAGQKLACIRVRQTVSRQVMDSNKPTDKHDPVGQG